MSTTHPLTLPSAKIRAKGSATPFSKLKERYGMYSGGQIERITDQLPADDYLVEGLIPPCSVNLLVGDSGIGKSPMAYQIGLAVAGGARFLGLPVTPGKVIFVDYENHLRDVQRIVAQQCRHLGLEGTPDHFLFWPLSRTPDVKDVEDIIDSLTPELVVIDSLRAYQPEMETDSVKAVLQIRKLRGIAARRGTASLLVHHVRRHLRLASAGLEDGHALDWLRRAAGVRALVNQTDVRLALARRAPDTVRTEGAADLVLSGHFRTRGDVGPFLIRRLWDSDGEPTGYERFEPNPAMIANQEQESAFHQLPGDFTFTEAKRTLGKANESVNWFLHKLVRLGLATKTGRGEYRKIFCSAQEGIAA
jgi:hypothetical protein